MSEDIVEISAEIVGGTIGGVVGASVAGPLGALIGSIGEVAATKVITSIISEMTNRKLSNREEIKLSNALSSSIKTLNTKISNGKVIRSDDFFDNKVNERSSAEEILEAVLYKAQREPEEKKIPYIGNIYANVVVDETIFPEIAHQVIKTAESLTYRQLCLLKIFSGLYNFNLRNSSYRKQESFDKELYSLLYECYDLYNRGLITNGTVAMFGVTDLIPSKVTIQGLGVDCFNLMGLNDIPNSDIEKYIMILRS